MVSLRESTRPLHDRVERIVDVSSLASSIERYARFLRRMLGLYDPLERRLENLAWRRIDLDFDARRKVHLLRADLLALGLAEREIEAEARCRRVPWPRSLAEGLGCLYVLEGATLGGRIIARTVQSGLGITPERGGRFLTAYGARTESFWRDFGAAADRHCDSDPRREARALAAARATFEVFATWLEKSET